MLRTGVFCFAALALAACAQGETAQDAAVDAKQVSGPDACVPRTEVCNGMDDNCNGMIDETFTDKGAACSAGAGACTAEGVRVCKADGTATECNAMAGDMTPERCDGIDNDCDGTVDDGFALGVACDGPDMDACNEGMTVCAADGTVTCSDVSADSVEVCNALDDDCDGMTDEAFAIGATCDGADTDACREGTITCAPDGTAVCSDMTSNSTELCNGTDDDCDGSVDDGFDVGSACAVGVGACRRTGTKVCSGATMTTCNVAVGTPTAEVCGDGIDQNCDGSDPICPANDLPAGAIDISAGGTFTVDLTNARDNHIESTSGCGALGGRDVYYTFTLAAPDTMYFDTFGSSFDSVMRLYSGACPTMSTLQGCADDACGEPQSQVGAVLGAGTYCLVVDQYGASQTTGNLTLTVVRGGRVGRPLTTATGSITSTLTGLTNVQSSTACQNNTPGPDEAFFFMTCPAQVYNVNADTCTNPQIDTVITYRKGSATAPATVCNDDSCGFQSRLPTTTISGAGIHWLVVDGYGGAAGPFTMTYSVQ